MTYKHVMLAVGEYPKAMGLKAAADAVVWFKYCAMDPLNRFDLWIAGFDDDPREVWDIPEARDQFQLFAKGAFEDGFDPLLDMVSPECVAMLLKCGCFPGGCKFKLQPDLNTAKE